MSLIDGIVRLIKMAFDSHIARLLEKMSTPYPNVAVSLARATTALRTGLESSLWEELATSRMGWLGFCDIGAVPLS